MGYARALFGLVGLRVCARVCECVRVCAAVTAARKLTVGGNPALCCRCACSQVFLAVLGGEDYATNMKSETKKTRSIAEDAAAMAKDDAEGGASAASDAQAPAGESSMAPAS